MTSLIQNTEDSETETGSRRVVCLELKKGLEEMGDQDKAGIGQCFIQRRQEHGTVARATLHTFNRASVWQVRYYLNTALLITRAVARDVDRHTSRHRLSVLYEVLFRLLPGVADSLGVLAFVPAALLKHPRDATIE